MLYKLNHILADINDHVKSKKPFSIVRIGDGDLKLLDALVLGRMNKQKFDRSGIPHNKVDWVLQLYRESCNFANYTSSFEMYYTDQFWHRKFSDGTKSKVMDWKRIYKKVGITNTNFCNPEIGHLLFLDQKNNLLKIMEEKRICLITCYGRVGKFLLKCGVEKADTIKIPAIGRGHYNQYNSVKEKISERIEDFDMFLISAGALGKGYALCIKNLGGIAIDVGQVINFWAGRPIAGRFRGVLGKGKRPGTFEIRKRLQQYRKFI